MKRDGKPKKLNLINPTEHKGKLEFVKRIPRTHGYGTPPDKVRFVLRIDGHKVITKPRDPIAAMIPDLVGKECVAIIGVWHGKNVLGEITPADTSGGNDDL